MKPLVIHLVCAARPNFMKIAPLYHALKKEGWAKPVIVHTGQHYDLNMSDVFFQDLNLPEPDIHLGVGSGSHAEQTGKVMMSYERVLKERQPDMFIVVGDVNSTLACSIVAKKLLIKVAHIEAGLRSFDLSMPEEINRIVTDSIADYFFVTEESGIKNLLQEGKPKDRIHFVGNVMIDNLFYQLRQLEKENRIMFSTYDLKKSNNGYAFLTLHRPSNVDSKDTFEEIAAALNQIAEERPILFPMHPRTKKMMEQFKIELSNNVVLLPPLGFKEALFLWKDAKLVMTDSGGLQEETTAMGVPCITLRENTERPITIEMGTNVLAGNKKESILHAYKTSINKKGEQYSVPPKWDGRTAERIWRILLNSSAGQVVK